MTPPLRGPAVAGGAATPATGLDLLGGAGDAPALVTRDATVTYAGLRDAVARTGRLLGTTRRLVLLEAANDVASVTTYLAALAGGHPVLLVAPGDLERHAELVERYDPDVVQAAGGTPRELRPGTAHSLHPDLAVLLSTSGSTGSPKLVRLSRANVVENARSIVAYLGIRDTDRAMASLPLHYCYGLSVLNSHLLAGAAAVLTDLSVADECFWDLAARERVTSFSGVPYTFDLLDVSGFADRDLPSLRYVTQAGGRLDPDRVVRYAELGRRRGWDLFVMYGQTEATARMAYLPPDRALDRPEAVGRAVPGGSLRIDPLPDLEEGVGELVYGGPNVMMGYAEGPTDLALGATLSELRTGDLARLGPDGLVEVVGRLKRRAKVFGLRIDLDRLERLLADAGHRARVVAAGERLQVFTLRARGRDRLGALTAALAGVPVGAVRVHAVDAVPTTPSGKIDHAALEEHARLADAEPAAAPTGPGRVNPQAIRDLYATLLGRPDAGTGDSFVDLGGDSLSFVEVSVRLGRMLGALPAGWAHLAPDELATRSRRPRRWRTPMETAVILRAVAILLVVVTHTDLLLVPGGAHLLLAVAGYNLARFTLATPGRGRRVRSLLTSTLQLAVPAAAWIAGTALLLGAYRPATALFLNQLLGGDTWSVDWQFWFLETLVWSYAGLAALLAIPAVDRFQRARPVLAAYAVLVAALAVRFAWTGVEAGPTERYTIGPVLWCLALGWVAATASTVRARLAVSAVAVAAAVGFFGDPAREAVVVGGVLLLVWCRTLPVPAALSRAVRTVAAASLWIYLTHWQVYPDLEAAGHPALAVVASVLVGVGCWAGYEAARGRFGRRGVAGLWSRRRSGSRAQAGTDPRGEDPGLVELSRLGDGTQVAQRVVESLRG